MKIVNARTEAFRYESKIAHHLEGHTHPGPERDAVQTLVKIITDEGAEGYCFGGDEQTIEHLVKPTLIGENPFYREKLWQRLKQYQRQAQLLSDRVLATIDMALWDLAGRHLNQPVYKLLSGYRDTVPAYASTMCGDEIEGGVNTPQAYADVAKKCKKRGYRAFKLHAWMPPYPGRHQREPV